MSKTTNILFIVLLMLSSVSLADAQERYRVTAQAGFQLFNSDDVSASINEGNRAWIFGVGVTSRRIINETPVDFNLGFTQGRTVIIKRRSGFEDISDQTNLQYRSLTFEAMRAIKLTDLVEISAGPNLVPQFRTIIYDFENISPGNDRLLSIGMGLSGKVSLVELPTNDKNIRLVMSLAGRWTNFFIHNARNRQIDGFRYNHIIVSPQLSIQF